MTPGEEVKVVIMDDIPCFAHGLKCLLEEADPGVVVTPLARRNGSGLDLTNGSDVDVFVMAADSPTVTDDISAVRAAASCARIVVLGSTEAITGGLHALIDAGATAFLDRSISNEEVVEVMRLVYVGDHVVLHSTAAGKLSARRGPDLCDLERAILGLIADGKETEQISRELAISRSTLSRYLRTGIRKLGARNRVHAAVRAMREGLI